MIILKKNKIKTIIWLKKSSVKTTVPKVTKKIIVEELSKKKINSKYIGSVFNFHKKTNTSVLKPNNITSFFKYNNKFTGLESIKPGHIAKHEYKPVLDKKFKLIHPVIIKNPLEFGIKTKLEDALIVTKSSLNLNYNISRCYFKYIDSRVGSFKNSSLLNKKPGYWGNFGEIHPATPKYLNKTLEEFNVLKENSKISFESMLKIFKSNYIEKKLQDTFMKVLIEEDISVINQLLEFHGDLLYNILGKEYIEYVLKFREYGDDDLSETYNKQIRINQEKLINKVEREYSNKIKHLKEAIKDSDDYDRELFTKLFINSNNKKLIVEFFLFKDKQEAYDVMHETVKELSIDILQKVKLSKYKNKTITCLEPKPIDDVDTVNELDYYKKSIAEQVLYEIIEGVKNKSLEDINIYSELFKKELIKYKKNPYVFIQGFNNYLNRYQILIDNNIENLDNILTGVVDDNDNFKKAMDDYILGDQESAKGLDNAANLNRYIILSQIEKGNDSLIDDIVDYAGKEITDEDKELLLSQKSDKSISQEAEIITKTEEDYDISQRVLFFLMEYINPKNIEFAWEDKLDRDDLSNIKEYFIFDIHFMYIKDTKTIIITYENMWKKVVIKLVKWLIDEEWYDENINYIIHEKITHKTKKINDFIKLIDRTDNKINKIEIILPDTINNKNISLEYSQTIEIIKTYTIIHDEYFNII